MDCMEDKIKELDNSIDKLNYMFERIERTKDNKKSNSSTNYSIEEYFDNIFKLCEILNKNI